MRTTFGIGALALLIALGGTARGQDDKTWKDAAKRLIVSTTDHMAKKVKDDPDAVADVKKLRERLLKEDNLAHVAQELKKKLDTKSPDADGLKELDAAAKKMLDEMTADDIKKGLKKPEASGFPCPPVCFRPTKKKE
jgi:hypothetical protein